MNIPEPITCPISGVQYYEQPPGGFRLATMDDVKRGRLKHNTAYLGKGIDGRYYCKRIRNTVPAGLLTFVESHRVYIWSGKSHTGDSPGVEK